MLHQAKRISTTFGPLPHAVKNSDNGILHYPSAPLKTGQDSSKTFLFVYFQMLLFVMLKETANKGLMKLSWKSQQVIYK